MNPERGVAEPDTGFEILRVAVRWEDGGITLYFKMLQQIWGGKGATPSSFRVNEGYAGLHGLSIE